MAVSGKTTKLEWPYYLGTDKPPDMAAVTKAQAEKAEALLTGTKGQLLVVQSTGAPAFKAMKGDGTLAEDGTLTAKDHSVSVYQAAAVTRTNVAQGSFSNPIKLTLPAVNANQLIEVFVLGLASSSVKGTGMIELGTTSGSAISATLTALNLSENPANMAIPFMTGEGSGFKNAGPGEHVPGSTIPDQMEPFRFIPPFNATNFAIELLGSTASGTITAEKVWMMARLNG